MLSYLLTTLLFFTPTSETLQDTVVIKEWIVPYEESRPRDPFVAPDGTVWFVGQRTGYAASLNPTSGTFRKFDLGTGAGPHNLIVDDQGMVWYAGNTRGHIGRLDPTTGAITKYPMPDPAARDPHTLVFDHNGDIWFTVQGGNFVGKLTTRTGLIELMAPTATGARPYGIVIDSENRPWIALFGTNKLATVKQGDRTLTEIDLPRADARPRRIQITSDDKVWYVDYRGGFLGRYDPESGLFKEWPMPNGTSARPYGMAVDADDRLWFVETGPKPNQFTGFDSKTESFIPGVAVPSGGGSVRHMFYQSEANEIWFGTDANTIGRARLPDSRPL